MKKKFVDKLKEFFFFFSVGNFWLKKRRIQTFCCKSKIVFVSKYRARKSSWRVRISILMNKNYCSGLLFLGKKEKNFDFEIIKP